MNNKIWKISGGLLLVCLAVFLWVNINVDVKTGREHHLYCKEVDLVTYRGNERMVGVCRIPRLFGLLPKKVIYEELPSTEEKWWLENRHSNDLPKKIYKLKPLKQGE